MYTFLQACPPPRCCRQATQARATKLNDDPLQQPRLWQTLIEALFSQ